MGVWCIGSLIEEWERKKREQLQQRREESARKKSVSMDAGKKALSDFEGKRKTDVERAQAKNRTDEKDTIASMEVRLRDMISLGPCMITLGLCPSRVCAAFACMC